MWHEARKQEKKIRGIMVDYKRRAERRREYYEKIKQDPAQFLQVHGRPAKIHLDPAVSMAADSPATMMPWQGDTDNLIDRFDVRAHLDIIPHGRSTEEPKLSSEEISEERQTNYERYRTLVQNDFLAVNEDKFLHQIFLEERYGPVLKPNEDEKKKLSDKKAAIGYIYEDSTIIEPPMVQLGSEDKSSSDDEKDDDLSDIDLDVAVDVTELSREQCAEMNEQSLKYGMVDDDFITFLLLDKEEAEQLKLAREIEEEKAMYSGRKSRRERRALREKKLQGRKITSPPSYAARDSPTYKPCERHSTSKSRSRSPVDGGKIMFITSFGGEGSDNEAKKKEEEKNKLGKKHSSKHQRSGKDRRSDKNSGNAVIGPQLPSQLKERKESRKESSYSSRRRRHSSSSSRSSRDRSPKRKSSSRDESDKYRKNKHIPRSPLSSSRSKYSKKDSHRSRSKSRSVSRSRSPRRRSRSRSRSKSRPKSQSVSTDIKKSPHLPSPPRKSYYRHSLSRSNSEISDESDQEKKDDSSKSSTQAQSTLKLQPILGKKAGPATKSKLTPQERLKRKMQLALSRQYKADKRAELERTEKQLQERQDRAEELREMAIKLRQRERERRHRLREYEKDPDSDSSWRRISEHSDDNISLPNPSKRTRSRSHSHSTASDSSSSSSIHQSHRSRSRSSSRSRNNRHRSPLRESKRSPPTDSSFSRKYSSHSSRKSPRRSPQRRSPRHSPRRSPKRSPRRSPKRSPKRSPRRSPRRSPHRSSSKSSYKSSHHRSPSPSRRSSPHRHTSRSHHRKGNRSRSRSRSVSRSSKKLANYCSLMDFARNSKPLVDY